MKRKSKSKRKRKRPILLSAEKEIDWHWHDDEMKISYCMEILLSNKKAGDLFDIAQQKAMDLSKKHIIFKLVDSVVLNGFDADSGIYPPMIRINKNLSAGFMVSSMIFELANIAQWDFFDDIDNKTRSGRYPIRQSYYIERTEMIELESAKIHNKIMRYGSNYLGWDANLAEFHNGIKESWKSWYDTTDEKHKSVYAQDWMELIKLRR